MSEIAAEAVVATAPESAPQTQSDAAPQSVPNDLANKIEDAVASGATEQEVKDMMREFEIKVGGKTEKIKVNLNDNDFIKKQLQLARAGRIAMQRLSEAEKGQQSLQDRLKNDPWSVLEEYGLNPDELSESRIRAKLAEMEKSPEQKAQEERQKELEELRDREKKTKTELEELKFARLMEEQIASIDNEIKTVLSATKTLPASPYVVKRIADTMLYYMDKGRTDVTAEDVLPIVEKEITEDMNKLVENLPDQMLEKYFGKKFQDRLRQTRLSQAKKAPVVPDTKVTATTRGMEEKKKAEDFKAKTGKRPTIQDFLKGRA